MASSGNRHCANCIGALSFPIQRHVDTAAASDDVTASSRAGRLVYIVT